MNGSPDKNETDPPIDLHSMHDVWKSLSHTRILLQHFSLDRPIHFERNKRRYLSHPYFIIYEYKHILLTNILKQEDSNGVGQKEKQNDKEKNTLN